MSAASPRPFLGARLLLFGFVLLTACSPFGQQNKPAEPKLPPGTTKGSIFFSPQDGSTELDPSKTEVLVRSANSDADMKSVTIKPDQGAPLTGNIQNGQVDLKGELSVDAHYTVTAMATVHHKGAADQDETQTSTFSTATTPKIRGTNPQSVGQGQSVVLSLDPAASAVSVEGPVNAQLAPDGLTVTVLPQAYQQGQTYSFTVVAKNKSGIAGNPQQATFNTLPPGTASASPENGSTLGVAYPITVTLSAPPADRAALVSHLAVSVQVGSPAAAGSAACAPYGTSAVASGPLPVSANWITDRKVQLVPKTQDGYWPAKSTISFKGQIKDLTTNAGNVFDSNISTTFSTGDKRVVDVNLSNQTLTTCKNGAQDQQFLVSTGTSSHPTYTGTFWIYSRVADEEMKSPEGPFAPDFYDIKHVPWTQYFDGGAALHGAWWHNNFGTPKSHGCVNVQDPTANTQWPHALPQAQYLWNFDTLGDPVIVHGVTPGLSPANQPSD
jgi:lipoprotein-anchoring transpeptidase ErfK/SrfK